MIKCPFCGAEVTPNYENDQVDVWNFDGNSADVEIYLFCRECEENFRITIPAKIELDFERMKER